MRAWKALGVVDTIYEEEPFEDSNSSSSFFLSPTHSSPLSPLHSRIQSWSQVTGRNPDVVIHVQGTCFHLHKDPLTSRSIYLRRHLTTESELTLSPPLNITAETFALVSEFSYGVSIMLTPFNVAALRTASELLDMTEPPCGEEENLWQMTESYFRQAVGVNRDYACIVLRSCLALLPEAETTAFLVSRCVEALGLTSDGHGIDSLFEDVKTVRPDDFRAVVESMHRRLTRHDLLYWIVDYYLKEHEGELSDEQKTQICNCIDCNKVAPRLLIHAVQNQVLPLRFLVRAMLVEQLNTRRSIFSATSRQTGPPPPREHNMNMKNDDVTITLGDILQRDAAMRVVAQLKEEMETTATRIQSLERELSEMKGLCLLQYESDENARIVDSGRSASFHYGTTSEGKIKREVNSSSCRFSDRRDVAGSSSSESPRVQKNIRQRLIHGLKSAFRVSKLGAKHHGSDAANKVRGESEESESVTKGHRRSQSTV